MKSREELLELFRTDPQAMVKHFLDLQGQREQLSQELLQIQGQVQQTQKDLRQTQKDLQQAQLDLAEAKAFIAELTRQLFGQKADKLSPEQEEQLKEVTGDLEEEAQRPPPISRQCLEAELAGKDNQTKE